ncbi:MAG: tRNA (adenosine(37)-N6)-threonylcarbamoyltransferase complex ATPase subunit type 1 TsaE [Candidatus Paceibacterota bacterium]|jgi:tRNA threonylcarbamoyladenosine biosynthesis protein TsaE
MREGQNLEELQAIAGAFLKGLSKMPPRATATVVGLSGDLGAGKTAFTKCVAGVLGITDVVTSPTFILEKIYNIPEGSVVGERFSKLVHIDAYRLEEGKEMAALGWEALLADSKNLVFLEWPEQVRSALPSDMIKISFEFVSENVRRVESELI